MAEVEQKKTWLQENEIIYAAIGAAIALLTQLIWQNSIGIIITGEMFGYAYGFGTKAANFAIRCPPVLYYLLPTLIMFIIFSSIYNRKKRYFCLAAFGSLGISLLIKLILFMYVVLNPIIAIGITLLFICILAGEIFGW